MRARQPGVRLTVSLRAETKAIHTQAERSGIVRDLLSGTITTAAYALLLRNLLPAYEALERDLERRRLEPAVATFARPELYRGRAIEADLAAISGSDWPHILPILPGASAYAALVAEAGREDTGAALVAHAYVRYFGDLSGGQILRRILAKTPGLPESGLGFYEFAGLGDLEIFKTDLRNGIDDAGDRLLDPQRVVAEALLAFEANIAVSRDVAGAART